MKKKNIWYVTQCFGIQYIVTRKPCKNCEIITDNLSSQKAQNFKDILIKLYNK